MAMFVLNPLVDKYLIDGCMRCKYGATPQCKVVPFREELEILRQFALESGLTEEIKWGAPVYTLDGKNILSVNALKHSANIGFFKGVLLKDTHSLLQQQGNIQLGRIIKFTQKEEILRLESVLKSYILEAIEVERRGEKVVLQKNPEPLPEELLSELDNDLAFKKAFEGLTLGRQRAYIIHFSQAKQSETRKSRILKHKAQILQGIGLHDNYKSK